MTIPSFLTDLVRRFLSKTPTFFKYIQLLGLLATAVVKAPDLLHGMGVNISTITDPWKTIIAVAGLISAFISQLAVSDQARLKYAINTK